MRKPAIDPAQREVEKLERQMRDAKEKLAKARARVKPQLVADYAFRGPLGETLTLSQAFGDRDELIVVHNMGRTCPYCTLWADGFNGLQKHLEDRAAFLLESPDAPAVQRRFANDRGWKFRMVSSAGTPFKADMGFADEDGDPIPGLSAFRRDEKGQIFRVAHSRLGPGDNFCVAWDLMDLLPGGAEWQPKFHYFKA